MLTVAILFLVHYCDYGSVINHYKVTPYRRGCSASTCSKAARPMDAHGIQGVGSLRVAQSRVENMNRRIRPFGVGL